MSKINENDFNQSEIEKRLKSSGKKFAKEYFNDVKKNLTILRVDPIFKTNYIKHIFMNAKCDKDYSGTRVRINALIRLVEKYNYEDIEKFIKQ